MTKPRRRTVAAVIAVALAIGVGAAAFALGSQSAADGTHRVKTSGFGPTTTETADGPLVSLVPVPSGPAPSTPSPAGAPATGAGPATAGPAPPTCSSRQVGLSVATDRPSYRPGDTVVVTALLKNASALPCAAPLAGPDGGCQPQVVLSISPGYGIPDVRLGPYAGACATAALLVPARSSGTTVVQAPFRLDAGYLPAGTWKVAVTWPGLGGTISAQTTLRCDLSACGAPVAATTTPTTPPPTVPPLTSTSTSTSTTTSTSAPAGLSSTTLATK